MGQAEWGLLLALAGTAGIATLGWKLVRAI